jgi:hypothetical protein
MYQPVEDICLEDRLVVLGWTHRPHGPPIVEYEGIDK